MADLYVAHRRLEAALSMPWIGTIPIRVTPGAVAVGERRWDNQWIFDILDRGRRFPDTRAALFKSAEAPSRRTAPCCAGPVRAGPSRRS